MSQGEPQPSLSEVDFDPFAGPAIAVAAPSTDPQREIWTAARLGDEASLAFNESNSLRLRGPLDVTALRAALADLVARHEALRATLSPDGLTLLVAPTVEIELPLVDLSAHSADARAVELQHVLAREVETPFDLERGPLLRATLVRLGEDDHQLVFTAHHVVVDGWSTAVLVGDWAKLYSARVRGTVPALPPAERFSAYARAQAERRGGPEQAAAERYWVKQFEGEIPVVDLPTERPRPAFKTFAARREDHVLDAELVRALRKAGAREGASLFVTLLGAFAALVQRLSGQDDLVIGVPAAGQAVAGAQAFVGHCVTTLPLRLRVPGDEPLRALWKRLRTTVLDAFEHQDLTFGALLQKLPLARDPGRQPLVSLLFNVDGALPAEALAFDGLRAEFRSNPRHFESFDLFLNAVDTGAECVLECQYNTDLFERADVRRWLEAFQRLLRAAADDSGTAVGDLPLVTPAEEEAFERWNRTAANYPPDALMHELIAAQARRTPGTTAVTCGEASLDYAALDARAQRLARRLRARGVGAGTLVGLCVERSLDMLVGLLGILKAGGAYVPLDPSYPAERLAFMVADSGMPLVVTQGRLAGRLPLPQGAELLIDGDDESHDADAPPLVRAEGATPASPAYVIYTSGSTGKPKGVRVPHRALVNFVTSMQREPGLRADDVLVAVTTLSFDIAGLELHLPLSVGARVVLADGETAASGPALRALVERSRATVMQATPATWRLLLGAGWRPAPGFKALCGGEPLPRDLAEALLAHVEPLWNMYGPTETTIWSTCAPLRRPLGPIVIGRPIANTQVHVLDARRRRVPLGVTGELYIGGDGVTLGYLNRPTLDAERFVPDPFRPDAPHARLYRTGDLARVRPDGNLECLGRNDQQVKVRGFRIELGEIETALAAHADVAQAVAAVHEPRAGDARLVAYLVGRSAARPDDDTLRAHLQRSLPPYMLPQHFVWLERLPLTPSGKLDRKALPAPVVEAQAAYVAPRGATESIVAALWADALGTLRLSVHDDFFKLGGHSLLAAQMLARLNREHGVALPFRAVFEHSTVERFARAVDAARGTTSTPARIPRRPAEAGPAPASLMQQRLWFLAQVDPSVRLVYNLPAAYRIRGALDPARLERCVNVVLARHDVLRTTLVEHDGEPLQVVAPTLELHLPPEPIDGATRAEREQRLRALVDAAIAEPFDLERGPLFRARLLRLAPDEHVLFVMAHHVVWDGWSFDLFVHELDVLYGAWAAGREPHLPAPAVSYGDFAAWHRAWLDSGERQRQLAYWRTQLAGELPVLALPADKPRPAVRSAAGATHFFQLSHGEAEALTALGQQADATLFMVLLAVFVALLQRSTGQDDVLVGSPVRGRTQPETEDLLGFFVNVVVLRARLDARTSFLDLLRQVRETALAAFAHEDIPFETLVQELQPPRDLSRTPIVQAYFSFQDVRNRRAAFGELPWERYHVEVPAAISDLMLWLLHRPDGVFAALNYSTDLFEPATMTRLEGRLRALLTAVLADPHAPLSDLSLFAPGEVEQLAAWNRASPPPAATETLPGLFAEQAARTPDAPAVMHDGRVLSYGDLDQRSNRLAAHLRRRGVGPETVVGLCVERSFETLVALLGILKAGGAYLPLDPAFPAERLGFMLRDARAHLTVTDASHADTLRDLGLTLVDLDADAAAIEGASDAASVPAIDGESLAYINYTSGSTGTPKGVEVLQRGVVRLVRSADYAELGPQTRMLHAANLAFDASTFEIWGALLNGGCVVLHPEPTPTAAGLAEVIRPHGVTTAWLTAALFNTLVEEDPGCLRGLRHLLTGGEALSVPHVRRALEALPELVISNGYGPTECTTFTTTQRVARPLPTDAGSIPIGRPIRATGCHVLDAHGRAVPPGVVGELHVSGAGLARGYLGRPELTAERFVPAPAGAPGERLYRTGDLVRHRSDGTLEFVGRADNQVKLRGFRVELGEIEAALARQPALRECAVLVREDRPGDRRLVAYFSARPGADCSEAELRQALRAALPAYMVPQHFVELPALPLNANGKVDRRALPPPFRAETDDDHAETTPRTPAEQLVAQAWSEALGVASVRRDDNFFDLGGHSLLALKVVAQLERRTGRRLNPRGLLLDTLEQLAAQLDVAPPSEPPEPPAPASESSGGLLARLWRRGGTRP